jgi:N-acetylmuramoyl-L-alanine amidase
MLDKICLYLMTKVSFKMTLHKFYSPNFTKRARNVKDIKVIVVHYTGMQSKIASIKRLSNSKYKVSCHFVIDRKGQVMQMVQEKYAAWHAGKSKWKNFINLNRFSLGIELVNKGHEFGYESFTDLQIKELIKLCLQLKKKYNIKNSNIVGHSDIAPNRKIDPGEKFPWQKLKKYKLGIWYKNVKLKLIKLNEKKIEKLFFKNLFKIGYRYFSLNRRTKNDIFIIKAFQRRFYSNNITGKIDKKTYIISHFLANHIKN